MGGGVGLGLVRAAVLDFPQPSAFWVAFLIWALRSVIYGYITVFLVNANLMTDVYEHKVIY